MQKLILIYSFTFLVLFSLQGAEEASSTLAPLDQTVIAAYKEKKKSRWQKSQSLYASKTSTNPSRKTKQLSSVT
ncbi:MAG: hypothetical protein LVQ75_04560 [Candidatus Babeliales bacterium]|jgi:hypothetical protein